MHAELESGRIEHRQQRSATSAMPCASATWRNAAQCLTTAFFVCIFQGCCEVFIDQCWILSQQFHDCIVVRAG